eukprot:4790746-Prymnesium_polylepis.1
MRWPAEPIAELPSTMVETRWRAPPSRRARPPVLARDRAMRHRANVARPPLISTVPPSAAAVEPSTRLSSAMKVPDAMCRSPAVSLVDELTIAQPSVIRRVPPVT